MEKINFGTYDNIVYFEGVDGTGKTEQSQLFCEWLYTTYKPFWQDNCVSGAIGLPNPPKHGIGGEIRKLILSKDLDRNLKEEMCLLMAARQSIFKDIDKFKANTMMLIIDRWYDSIIYQLESATPEEIAYIRTIDSLNQDKKPYCGIYLMADNKTLDKRLKLRNLEKDRFESEDSFVYKIREGYRSHINAITSLAEKSPVDYGTDVAEIYVKQNIIVIKQEPYHDKKDIALLIQETFKKYVQYKNQELANIKDEA